MLASSKDTMVQLNLTCTTCLPSVMEGRGAEGLAQGEFWCDSLLLLKMAVTVYPYIFHLPQLFGGLFMH